MAKGFNFARAFSRPQSTISPNRLTPEESPGNQNLPYADYGLLPGVAQAAQNNPGGAIIGTPPAFTTAQLAAANWFTTRVHLSPLGSALNGEG